MESESLMDVLMHFDCGKTTCTNRSKEKYEENMEQDIDCEFDKWNNIKNCCNTQNQKRIFHHEASEKCPLKRGKSRRKLRRIWMDSTSSVLYLFFFLIVLTYCEAKSGYSKGPPRVDGPQPTVLNVRLGEAVTLPCKIVGESNARTKWVRNGSSIGDRRRDRIRRKGTSLKIKSVQLSDVGDYQCVKTNVFGRAETRVILKLQDDMPPFVPPAVRPRFSIPTKMRERTLVKPVGSLVRLRCKASGSPTPQILWYKDEQMLETEHTRSTKSVYRRPNWIYEIKKVQLTDSGTYMCRVWNDHGEISYNYTLEVVGAIQNSPILVEPHPQNTTVRVGGMATFQCRVRSDVTPTVKWIKRVDKAAILSFGDDLPGRLLNVESNHYLILPTGDMVTMPDKSFLNKLVIRQATEKDAGMYICLAANEMGYNFRYAYLTVVPNMAQRSPRAQYKYTDDNVLEYQATSNILNEQQEVTSSKSSLPIMIGIPAAVGLLIVLIITIYCQRQRDVRFKSQKSTFSTGTKSTRSTPMSEIENNGSDPKLHSKPGDIASNRPGTYPGMPSSATPLLNEDSPASDNQDEHSLMGQDEPLCPPPSAITASSTNVSEQASFIPPPPPPSQHSMTSSVGMTSSAGHMYPPPHYHFPSSRRHHHHHHHKHRPQHDFFYRH